MPDSLRPHELPGSSVHGISQTGILESVAIPFFRGSSQPRDQTGVSGNSCIVEWVLHHSCHLESQSDLARSGVGGGVSCLQDTRTTSEQDAFFQREIQSCYQGSTNSCFPYMNINSICGVFHRQQQILKAQQAGLGEGSKAQEEEEIYILNADLFCCTTETNTTL